MEIIRKNILSVIVPVYNVELYLEQCVESILTQEYHQLDIILVDDGSTDSSGSLCDLFSKKDERVRVIHKKNEGLIGARYTGVCEAIGDFITFVDSDDWISPEMYENLMALILDNDADMVSAGFVRYWNENKWKKTCDDMIIPGLYDKRKIEEDILPHMLWCKKSNLWSLDPSLCNKIFKKNYLIDCYEDLKKYTFYFGEDSAITYPYILKAQKIYISHNNYYFHRQRTENNVAPYILKDNFFDELYKLYKYLFNIFLENKNSDILLYQLEHFYMKSIVQRNRKYQDKEYEGIRYLFPYEKVDKNSRIVIYGAGKVGHEYYEQIIKSKYCEIILWVDKNYFNLKNENIVSVEKIFKVEYDFLIIANASDDIKLSIKKELINLGVKKDKVIL